jgi:hypothetical protein
VRCFRIDRIRTVVAVDKSFRLADPRLFLQEAAGLEAL